MWLLLALLGLALAGVPLARAIQRSNELFVIRVKAGKVQLVRGRIPHALMSDIEDVLERARADEVEVKVLVEGQAARVHSRGLISDGTRQQLRNVVGTYPLQKIRAGQKRP